MCGICGILAPERKEGIEDLDAMVRSLGHRGPDDSGMWSGRFRHEEAPHTVAFGHTRLSILDLSPLGRQPMSTDDGAVTVSYNGEIYNFREIREELIDRGFRFHSRCDTEVLLQAYVAWGTAAFDRLRGMFAFAIWDAARGRLLLVRDRLGIKPLHYQFLDGLLLFGSELRALRCHRGFKPAIDRGALGSFLRGGYVAGRQTIYQQTFRVLPGEFVVWEAGRLERRTYWSIAGGIDPAPPDDLAQAVKRLDSLLGDAVEERLVADVPVGAFLSGGIDSSAVVALMQERARGSVRTFSVGFEEPDYDEAPDARTVANHLGTEHTELYVNREQAIEIAYALPDIYDEPFADASAIPTVLISRLARGHVTVVLSGDGGDELFGGYGQYGKLRRLLPFLRLPRSLRLALSRLSTLSPSPALQSGLGHLRNDDECSLAASLICHFEPEMLRAVAGDDGAAIPAAYRQAFSSGSAPDPLRRATLADASVYLPGDILAKVDRASMSVGLETRVPILDHRVVQFAFSLPFDLACEGELTKAPLRGLLYRRLPRALVDRPKKGFGIPIAVLLADQLRAWSERYLRPERLLAEGNFEPAGIQGLLGAVQGRSPRDITRLWFVLCFQRWFAHTHLGERD